MNMATGGGHYAIAQAEIAGSAAYDPNNNMLHGVLPDGSMDCAGNTSNVDKCASFVGGLASKM